MNLNTLLATFYELIVNFHSPWLWLCTLLYLQIKVFLKTFREVLFYFSQHENCLVLQVPKEDYDHGSLLGDLWMRIVFVVPYILFVKNVQIQGLKYIHLFPTSIRLMRGMLLFRAQK